VITLNLTINNTTSSNDIITACDSATWIDGNTYNASTNIPTFTLTNAAGCDSIVTLNLTINNTTLSTDVVTACDSITWIDGNTYSSNTTTPTYTVVGGSVTGCDSVVTLNLTISPIDISVIQNPYTLNAAEIGASYQWLDCNNGNAIIPGETNQTYIPASSGNYAVVVSKNGCTDTSACVNFCNIDAYYLFNDNGNGNYTFTNATSGNYTQSHWAFGDGTTSTATNPNHTFTVNNTFAVVLTINDSTTISSCMGYYIDVITVTGVVTPLQCAAGFTIYADTNNINVILNATGNNLTYLWDFGDGNTSNAQFPTHTYATNGNYYLCLTIDDGAGCVDMYCDSIGENGVVFNKQNGFTINVIAPPLATQINEQATLTSGVTIYPNPTTAEFMIEWASFSPKTQLSIVSVEGKTVYTNNTINTNKIVVNAADWSKGIYVVKITDKQSSNVVKLIKQ
jgi:PKD repeat protein